MSYNYLHIYMIKLVSRSFEGASRLFELRFYSKPLTIHTTYLTKYNIGRYTNINTRKNEVFTFKRITPYNY